MSRLLNDSTRKPATAKGLRNPVQVGGDCARAIDLVCWYWDYRKLLFASEACRFPDEHDDLPSLGVR